MPVLLALACLLVSFVRPNLAAEEPAMFAHFIDVGQAQAILLEFPCGAVLIDAGTQNGDATKLISYLNHFFARRADLDRTLQALFITHAHVDHTTGLDEIATNYTVLNYIDNGLRAKRGGIEPRRFLEGIQSGAYPRTFPRPVTNEQIEDLDGPTGITDSHIDPVSCARCDPVINILAASREKNPGWRAGDFTNYNNHSLVIRVDFGSSSFLFTGDLEQPAIEALVSAYAGTELLNVDIYQVGHHGSENGTTVALLEAMSPQAAVISVGAWNDGLINATSAKPFTTYAYGHPRRSLLEDLSQWITGHRAHPVTIQAADGAYNFRPFTVKKRIYATAWDGTVTIRASLNRQFRVTFEHE